MTSETLTYARQSNDQVATPQSPIPLRPILLRAGVVALVIGSVLTLINQSSALFGAAQLELVPLVLVFLTPFIVVAVSQILGFRQASKELNEGATLRTTNEPFWTTVAGHGIPLRAALIGLIAGSVNASITIAGGAGGAGEALPLVPIAQAVALPMLFSVLSQALSYRRAVAAHTALSST